MQITSDSKFLGYIEITSTGQIKDLNFVAQKLLQISPVKAKNQDLASLFHFHAGQSNYKNKNGSFVASCPSIPEKEIHGFVEGHEVIFYVHERPSFESSLATTFSSLELDDKIYRLNLISNLLKTLSDVIELKEILRNYAEFVCENLFVQAAAIYCVSDNDKVFFEDFIELDSSLDYRNQRQKMHGFMRKNQVEMFKDFRFQKHDEMNPALREAYEQDSTPLTGVLQVPIFSGSIFLGSLHFLNYEQRALFNAKEIEMIKMTLEQIKPFINNSLNYSMAMTDELTKVYNKRMFNLYLEKYFSHYKQGKLENLCLLLFDIDHFKKVNDTYGHSGGDVVLHNFANELSQSVRAGDSIFRIGGEEFAILLKESKDNALSIAQRIFSNLAKRDYQVSAEKTIKVTASCGLTHSKDSDASYHVFFDRADQLLYRSKHEGRNRITLD